MFSWDERTTKKLFSYTKPTREWECIVLEKSSEPRSVQSDFKLEQFIKKCSGRGEITQELFTDELNLKDCNMSSSPRSSTEKNYSEVSFKVRHIHFHVANFLLRLRLPASVLGLFNGDNKYQPREYLEKLHHQCGL